MVLILFHSLVLLLPTYPQAAASQTTLTLSTVRVTLSGVNGIQENLKTKDSQPQEKAINSACVSLNAKWNAMECQPLKIRLRVKIHGLKLASLVEET